MYTSITYKSRRGHGDASDAPAILEMLQNGIRVQR